MGGAGEEEGNQVSKESELLIANLGSEQLRKNNILLDHNTMKLIGILHESLVSPTYTPPIQQRLAYLLPSNLPSVPARFSAEFTGTYVHVHVHVHEQSLI